MRRYRYDRLRYKLAGAEKTILTDPKLGLPIYVTTSARLKYRQYYSEAWAEQGERDFYGKMRNKILNEIIAQDYAASADKARHYYPANSSDIFSRKREWVEFRGVTPSRPHNFFISIIGPNGIRIVGTTTVTKYPLDNANPHPPIWHPADRPKDQR